jgi:PAS domain S-box-containing protein
LVSVTLLTATWLVWPAVGLGLAATAQSGAPLPALLNSSFNVAAATVFMASLPRRARWSLPRRRWRLQDVLFVLSTTCLTPVAAILWGPGVGPDPRTTLPVTETAVTALVVAGLVAALLASVASERLGGRLAEHLRRGRAAGRLPADGALQARLPRELARIFQSARRVTDRLHRLTARQGLQLESSKRRLGRAQQSVQAHERALREKELALSGMRTAVESIDQRWRAFIESVPDALIIADRAGRIEFVNGAIHPLLGHQAEKLVGTPVDALLATRRDSDPLGLEPPALEGDPEQPPREQDMRFKTAQGTSRELSARVQGFYVKGERRVSIRLRDVSGLRHVVKELKQARAASGSTQRARDQFVATMSHEIRTPLHGLMATLDMLRSESFSAEGRHRLAIARMSAKALINIANDVLDLSRINAGGVPLELKPMSLERLIAEVMDEARARAESADLRLRTQAAGALPPSVLGDPVRIKQILRNLVANALKFTTAGGVTLQVSHTDGECIVDVTDTGQGVPEGKRESIFEPFVQADAKSSRRFGGAGLGLPISRKLSEAMNGSLTLLRSSPSGSTFRLVLPLPVSDDPPVEEQSQRILQLVQGRILVVEDDVPSQYVAQTLLGSLECPARIASNGKEALELIRAEEFDLVLMDCEMPEMDGYETTQRIRKALEHHIPIVAMTASTMMSDRQRCFDAGMDDILPKPFGKSALNDVLGRWLAPQSGASKGTLAERVAALPTLDAGVFEELRESLHWQLPPLRRIYASFRESAQEIASLATQPEASDDLETRRVHSLQGSAGLVGARQIEYLAARLAEAARERKSEEREGALQLLRESLRRFEHDLDNRLDAISGR